MSEPARPGPPPPPHPPPPPPPPTRPLLPGAPPPTYTTAPRGAVGPTGAAGDERHRLVLECQQGGPHRELDHQRGLGGRERHSNRRMIRRDEIARADGEYGAVRRRKLG